MVRAAKSGSPPKKRRPPMTEARARQVLTELRRRARLTRLLEEAFPKQRAFLDDTTRFRAAYCTRRAGKSYGIGLKLFERALARANVTCIYVALTRMSAKRIMWRDILHVIDRQFAIGAVFNESELIVTLPNGSTIYLVGGDATEAEAAKFKGLKPVLVVVDECQDFRTDLEKLCRAVIRPALIDNRGELLLCGVPGNVKNYFWAVTTGAADTEEWSVHHWTAFDNPHVANEWALEIEELKAKNPRVVEAPWFKQEYLGLWVIDTRNLCVPGYTPANDVGEQPDIDGWNFVLGVDLGFMDATALVLVGWSDHEDKLWILKARARKGLDFTATANWIKSWQEKFPIHAVVIDGASKQGVEEMINRHGLTLERAEKQGKADALGMLSADLTMEKVVLLQPHCAALSKEWEGLVWDAKAREAGKLEEHPSCPNHLSDAALYAWRRATNYSPLPKPKDRSRAPQTKEEMDERQEELDEEEELEAGKAWWEKRTG